MSSLIVQQPIQMNSNTNIGLDASMHTQTNTSHLSQNTTSKEAKKDDGWTIIKKTQRFSIFIPQDSLPGDNIIAKKNFVYRKILDVLGLISLASISIKGIKTSNLNNDVRFAKLEVINNQQYDNFNDYEIKIWDVPLDVDKQMLEVYLKSFGPIKTLKFNVKNLYYKVVVRFNGTYAADLKDIIIQMKAKSCFVPKNRFSKNYEKERFAFVFFDNENDFNNALEKKFSFNNRGLVFVNYDAVTCHVCGSLYHRVRTCPENQRKRNMSSTHEVYQQIYSRYGVKAPRPSMGFRPLFPRNSQYQPDKSEVPNVRANVLTSSQSPSQSYKGKGKQQETQEPVRKPWNQQNINPTPVNNESDRLDRLERQMEKFINMIQRLNERISNLEINHINQAEILSNRKVELMFVKDDNTFMNNNNKRVKEFQQTHDVYIDKNVSPNVQIRTLSPMEEDSKVNKTVETEKFIYEPLTVLVQPIDIQPFIDGIININNTFKITTINVSGLNTTLKQEQVLNYMKINKISCLIVTETKLQTASAKMIYKDYKDITTWWSCDDDNHFLTGVRIIMNNDYAKYVIKKDIIENQALKLTLLLKEKIRFTIIAIYNFSNNSHKDEILEFYMKLEEILTAEKKLQDKIVCIGDFNASYDTAIAQQRANRKIFWKDPYAEKIEKLLDKEKDIIDSVEILINNINRIWNTIRDTFKKANSELPKKKGNPNKEVIPKTIVFYKRFLHKLSYILTNLTEKKIMSLNLTNYRECKKFIEKYYETISEICFKFAIDIDGLLDKNIKEFKEIVKIAFKLVQYEDLQDNKKRFLDSTLNRKRSKIVLDKIVIKKNSVKQLISDEELIENELIEHFRSFAGKKLNSNEKLKERWIHQYNPKQDINECWYNEVIQPISESEWKHMIRQLANDKAPGISQISNEMLKHMGTSMKSVTLKLANLCLQVERNILKGGNHAGLPGGSTEAPLRIINTCIENAKKNNKEVWLTFQDLSKAYDRVDIKMLKLALQRIKIPEVLICLMINLFTNSKKSVIKEKGITKQYTSIIGIDQGEVISPLLWTIYYDPLLAEINLLKMGYEIEYCFKTQLEQILKIADKFNIMNNNIQTNYDKFEMITNKKLDKDIVEVNFRSSKEWLNH
ncbi:RNA-directed DNA polymerase from mobile element jockey-like [Rhizophagus irregularis DAOM 181602=DAOM 197198]|nr:RNA-directed DNA polymerase from mobile element jockey-like [Rhizophagus irregularis DAOM 181602=DAOM 197198]